MGSLLHPAKAFRVSLPARASGKGRDFCDVFAPRLDSRGWF